MKRQEEMQHLSAKREAPPLPPSRGEPPRATAQGVAGRRVAAPDNVASYLGRLHDAESELGRALATLAERHDRDAGVRDGCRRMASWSAARLGTLQPFLDAYGFNRSQDVEHLRGALFHGARWGSLGMLRDLQDVALLAEEAKLGWTCLQHAAPELRDAAAERAAKVAVAGISREIAWLETTLKSLAPQALGATAGPLRKRLASLPSRPWPRALAASLWVPLAAGSVGLLVALAGVPQGLTILVPSLGPSILLLALQPAAPSSHPWNIAAGHCAGWIAGAAAASILGTWTLGPLPSGGPFLAVHAAAAAIALALVAVLTLLGKASHPPAAATALMVAFGALHTPREAIAFAAGLALVCALAVPARRLRLGAAPRPDPTSPQHPA